MTANKQLPSGNPDWGFFGTVRHHCANPSEAWAIAGAAIADAIDDAEGYAAEGIRDFLDSRDGRHFADSVSARLVAGEALKASIHAAVAEWQG